jgi:hypothetical protein
MEGEHIDLDYFYRPQTKQDIADTKHAFAMRDLKKGDKFTRPDFTSFSFDVPRRINSQNQGAVYSSLLPERCNLLVLDPYCDRKSTNVSPAGMKFRSPRCAI